MRLERKAQNADLASADGLHHLRDLLYQAITQRAMHLARRGKDLQRYAGSLRQLRQRIDVAFCEGAAECGSRLQATRSDLLIESERHRQVHRISPHVLAQAGKFVDERYL